MRNYILKRILLIIPTLLGIMAVNFLIIQLAPGGPVEKMIAKISGVHNQATSGISGSGASDTAIRLDGGGVSQSLKSKYRGARGIDPELIEEIKEMYGFNDPLHIRFGKMIISYAQFDFGDSFFRDEPVINLIKDKLPVSISLGLWTTLIVYLISIPLGVRKAVRDGSKFDIMTSWIVIIGYAIPGFMFAILLIILFGGGSYFDLFPVRGLASDDFDELSLWGKFTDYLWHITLPIFSMVIGGFAGLCMLTKNLFLEELSKQYVMTARAKGLTENRVLYGHVFRNAMLVIISGFPAAFLSILFTGALLVEIIFSLDGLGFLAFESAINRDYPIIFASLYIFTLLGLVFTLLSDLMYVITDPRIDFEKRET